MAETPGDQRQGDYFDTPERAERLQLVAHVVRNTEATPYVRGPEGAGKTRFAERLAALFRREATLVQLAGTAATNIPEAVCKALGIGVERWPVAAVDAASEGGLLVVVDDADRLDPVALEALHGLRAAGGKLIFLGSSDPAELPVHWELQLIDLPPLSASQVREFAQFLGDPAAALLQGVQLTRLHRECRGLPGAVIAVLAAGRGLAAVPTGGQRPRLGRFVGLAALLGFAGLVLWQQDRINAWFEPPREPVPVPVEAVPPVVTTPAPAPPAEEVAPEALARQVSPVIVPAEPVEPAEPLEAVAAPETLSVEPVEMPAEAPVGVVPAEQSAQEPVTEEPQHAAEAAVAPPAPEPIAAAAEPAAQALPEPAVSVTPPESPAEASPQPAPAASEHPGQRDLDWLRGRDPKAYTLQLVGARDRDSIDRFVVRYGLAGNYVVYERDLGGKPWYSLIYGEYPGLPAAKRARAALPADLHSAWPRTFESVVRQLPAAD